MKEKKKESYNEQKTREIRRYQAKQLRKRELIEQRIVKERSLGTLLLVEDDPCMSEELKSFLEDNLKGWSVLTAKTLEEAEKLLNTEVRIDFVITDMSYPRGPGQIATEKSGLDLIRIANKWSTDVIAYSSLDGYLMSAKEAGAEQIFNKRDMTKLCDAVRKKAEFIETIFNRREPKPEII